MRSAATHDPAAGLSSVPEESLVAVVAPAAGRRFLEPVIEALQARGCEVVGCDTFDDAVHHEARDRIGVVVALGAGGFRDASAFPQLRLIASPIISTEDFDLDGASDLNIVVANGRSPVNADSMAEATILLILAALYDLRRSERVLRENLPRQPPYARTLAGRTIGLVGFGDIARAIARRLQFWDVTILAYSWRTLSDLPDGVGQADLDEVLVASDVVVLLSRLSDKTRFMIDARRLAALKYGAVLVNTGRGGLVDEAALTETLRERPDLTAAIDTFTTEPLPKDSPLRRLENVILTPHCVGHTSESVVGLQRQTVANVMAAFQGDIPPGIVNPGVASRWSDRFGRP